VTNRYKGEWNVRVRAVGEYAGQLDRAPAPTYQRGKGISLFAKTNIPADYVKAKAQAGDMGATLYAVVFKTSRGLEFRVPTEDDRDAIEAASDELSRRRKRWEDGGIIPTEARIQGDCDRSYVYGLTTWADLFSPRQLLGFGVLVEELRTLRSSIIEQEGEEMGKAINVLLAFMIDKFANWNSALSSWNVGAQTARSVFDRHDFSFKPTFCEMAPTNLGSGLDWAMNNVLDAYTALCDLPRAKSSLPTITLGSATNLPALADGSIVAVVVDPPYDDNVQYAELADFFYVWLKRTLGWIYPEWYASYLCDYEEEAVVNISRNRIPDPQAKGRGARGEAAAAREKARAFYTEMMARTFSECRRVLRDEGALTVMFTHKKQEAWEALFSAIIAAGFQINAAWPIRTEGWHSLHQARKNSAESTVILVARKRIDGGTGYFDSELRREIVTTARAAAERLEAQGLNPVDQLVGSFGPAMGVFSRYNQVRTDTGDNVPVGAALDLASDAVTAWRVDQLAARGIEGVEPEGRFVLMCWDVLGAGEFRFNEAKLLGHAVGMNVDELVAAGLVSKEGEKIKMLSAKQRRRDHGLGQAEAVTQQLKVGQRGRSKADALKVHPNDASFRTVLDACHALALRYLEAPTEDAGIGAARGLLTRQGWTRESGVARLMEALVHAAPVALRRSGGRGSAADTYPEFRAWHDLLGPLFAIEAPDWSEPDDGVLSLDLGLLPVDDGEEAVGASEDSEAADDIDDQQEAETDE
jgi:adenine-specific DNA methylase